MNFVLSMTLICIAIAWLMMSISDPKSFFRRKDQHNQCDAAYSLMSSL